MCRFVTLLFLLHLFKFFGESFSQDSYDRNHEEEPVVNLKRQGRLHGLKKISRDGRSFYAFLGIPYGKINKRFAQPELGEAWNGTRNATKFGTICLQYDWLRYKVRGKEDCLFLNVYTPKIEKPGRNSTEARNLLPVLIYVHGGAYMFGTGNKYGGKYIMDEDAVLITFNYRLGVMGFLSTEDFALPGNLGLKDQVLALKWVQENIIHFSGNASRVTLFGESAGGSSVSLLLLSPMSQGLFLRGISHSGTALCPWAFVRRPRLVANRLGNILECPTNNSRQLVECLRSLDGSQIVKAQLQLSEWNKDPFALFGPTIEYPNYDGSVDVENMSNVTPEQPYEPFLLESPYKLLCQGNFKPLPWILGILKDEGLTFHAASILSSKKLTKEMDDNWFDVAPITFQYKDTARYVNYVSNKIRSFYFGSKSIADTSNINKLQDLYSDRYFFHCTHKTAILYSKRAPLYLYYFQFHGKHSILDALKTRPDIKGVAHGDDLQYLFDVNIFPEMKKGSREERFSKKLIKLWLSFVKSGKPEKLWPNLKKWHPVELKAKPNESKSEDWNLLDYQYCGFNDTLQMIKVPFKERLRFWDQLPLQEYQYEITRDHYNQYNVHEYY